MSRWGSGYSYSDPCYCDTWDDFVYKCNNPGQTGETYTYIALPTVDQQGNPIPPERRVMDLRSHDWYRSTTIINQSACYLWIEGNGWTILGLSIRDTIFFNCNKASPSSSGARNWNSNTVIRNLVFKNIYLQGESVIFKANANGSRFREVSGCKFSGVIDTSSVSDPHTKTTNGLIQSSNQYAGYNVFTACSFNFKFVSYARIIMEVAGSASLTTAVGSEFNNCLISLSGKLTVRSGSQASTSSSTFPPMFIFRSKFYFCKFTGTIIIDDSLCQSQNSYFPFYWNDRGTLNVIDFDMPSYPYGFFNFTGYLEYGCYTSTEVEVFYINRIASSTMPYPITLRNIQYDSCFKKPSSRAQLVDETWLSNNGFVVGSPPTD